MSSETPSTNNAEQVDLNPQEQRIIKTLRLLSKLEPTTTEQVEEFIWSLVARYLTWSYSDPDSLARAQEFAALDPFLRREVEAINEEFACTEGDGLEDY
jgi:hypothetical protein